MLERAALAAHLSAVPTPLPLGEGTGVRALIPAVFGCANG